MQSSKLDELHNHRIYYLIGSLQHLVFRHMYDDYSGQSVSTKNARLITQDQFLTENATRKHIITSKLPRKTSFTLYTQAFKLNHYFLLPQSQMNTQISATLNHVLKVQFRELQQSCFYKELLSLAHHMPNLTNCYHFCIIQSFYTHMQSHKYYSNNNTL